MKNKTLAISALIFIIVLVIFFFNVVKAGKLVSDAGVEYYSEILDQLNHSEWVEVIVDVKAQEDINRINASLSREEFQFLRKSLTGGLFFTANVTEQGLNKLLDNPNVNFVDIDNRGYVGSVESIISSCLSKKQELFKSLPPYEKEKVAVIFNENATNEEVSSLLNYYNFLTIWESKLPVYAVFSIGNGEELWLACSLELNGSVGHASPLFLEGQTSSGEPTYILVSKQGVLYEKLVLDGIHENRWIEVIIGFANKGDKESNLKLQSDIIASLNKDEFNLTWTSSNGGGFSGYINQKGLDGLAKNSNVTLIRTSDIITGGTLPVELCGDGICDSGENMTNCARDCVKTQKNYFIYSIIITMVFLIIIFIVIFYLVKKKK